MQEIKVKVKECLQDTSELNQIYCDLLMAYDSLAISKHKTVIRVDPCCEFYINSICKGSFDETSSISKVCSIHSFGLFKKMCIFEDVLNQILAND